MADHKYGHYQYYEVFRTFYKERNLPENRCDEEKDGGITVRECIEGFVDSYLGCHIPWHRNKPGQGGEKCTNKYQYTKYVTLSNKLSSLDAKEMEEETGCMRRCERMEYKLWETTPLGMRAKYKPDKLKFSFIFSSGKRGISHMQTNLTIQT